MRVPRTAAALALLVGGCASLPGGRPPTSGRPWRELVSDHFVVRTDVDEAPARSLAGELELLRGAVLAGLFQGAADPPGRVEVIAFSDADEFQAFAPPFAAAYYLRGVGGPPRIVMPGSLGAYQKVALAHELTHHLSACLFPGQVRWLSEGLAVSMEGLAEVPLGPTVRFGQVPTHRLPQAALRRVSAAELLAWDDTVPPTRAIDFYVSALLVVRHLVEQDPEAFRGMLDRLADGAPAAEAFRDAFPRYDPARPGALESLDREVAGRLSAGTGYAGRTIAVRAGDLLFERELPQEEVLAIRLDLWPRGPPKPEAQLRAELAEALRLDPAHPFALQIRARLDGRDPLPDARAAVAAHPVDARAWTFLALALQGPEAAAEREAAYRRALELVPDSAAAAGSLARELLAQGRPEEALRLAWRAVELAPWSPEAAAVRLAALTELGRCDEARVALRRVSSLLGDRPSAADREEIRRRREAFDRACGAGG